MVSYQEWTEIGHEVYQSKGGEYPRESTATDVTRTLAEYWKANKSELQSASRSRAERMAEEDMSV